MTPPGRIAETSAKDSSLVYDFSAAAFDSAIQRPVNAISQLGGKLIGHELPKLQLVELSEANSGANKVAQQAGHMVGMVVPFLATRAGVRTAVGTRLGSGYGAVAFENAATGFVMGSALTPVDKDKPFWSTRLANGVTDAGTFMTLGVAVKGLASTKAFAITGETSLLGSLKRGSAIGAISGLPAGFVNSELHSLTHGKGLASASDVATTMAGFALFGGVLGTVDGGVTRSRFRKLVDGEKPGTAVSQPKVETVGAKTEAVAVKPEAQPKVETVGAKGQSEKILSVKQKGYIDAGDEGAVYSNGDGSVTKVFKDKNRSMEEVKDIYDKLASIGIRVPKIFEIGKTESGQPAIRMEQVGDGDHLSFQLMMREITGADKAELAKQYYAFADALAKAGWRIDWQLKNMRFQDGKLYMLDPSFLKHEPMGPMVEHYGRAIGPRPE